MASSAAAKIVHVAGWSSCAFYKRAYKIVSSLAVLFPNTVEVVQHEFSTREEYRNWLIQDPSKFRETPAFGPRAVGHTSSPFCWLSAKSGATSGTSPSADDATEFIGGHDDVLEWCRSVCGGGASPGGEEEEGASVAAMVDDGHRPNHGYDWDLVVIGGGSGGLSASKEAAKYGARVAVLDYVKPTPVGTSWGLGGTCVNVGCIPKKLMHQAAILNTAQMLDQPHFGIGLVNKNGEENNVDAMAMDMSKDNEALPHSWDVLRTNVQNYVRSLNFKYRVNLRENSVTYLNKLGRFVDGHTIEVTDKKGKTETITSSRFLVAVGGRPTPLDCPGGELAISSDDVFSMEADPGRVLCVGASYISLECAGFLRGMGRDVTVAVRSILLRGFDRECADLIGEHMEHEGVTFRRGVVPTKLEKLDSGKIRATFSDGESDEYDTVLAAIGRTGDTAALGLENAGVSTNPKNGKVSTTHEQSSVPNIYAIGDVMDGCPELTPVAIQAGTFLSRRLFGGSRSPMDYRNICTTVFTPIEYGTVGYSEDDALEEYGADKLDVYHKEFVPLEWSISHSRSEMKGFCKAIVRKSDKRVLGLHYLGPNAGEVMQGFGTAIKKDLTFDDLTETVGIHPTTAEELTTLSVTKSSGASAAASGC